MATITRIGNFFDRTEGALIRYGFYTGPASYVTGGETLNPEELALAKIHVLLLAEAAISSSPTAIRFPRYSVIQKKLQWFEATGNEVAAGTNLSTFGARFVVYGQ